MVLSPSDRVYVLISYMFVVDLPSLGCKLQEGRRFLSFIQYTVATAFKSSNTIDQLIFVECMIWGWGGEESNSLKSLSH